MTLSSGFARALLLGTLILNWNSYAGEKNQATDYFWKKVVVTDANRASLEKIDVCWEKFRTIAKQEILILRNWGGPGCSEWYRTNLRRLDRELGRNYDAYHKVAFGITKKYKADTVPLDKLIELERILCEKTVPMEEQRYALLSAQHPRCNRPGWSNPTPAPDSSPGPEVRRDRNRDRDRSDECVTNTQCGAFAHCMNRRCVPNDLRNQCHSDIACFPHRCVNGVCVD